MTFFRSFYLTVQSYIIGRQEYIHSFPFALILYLLFIFVAVIQSLSHVWLLDPWNTACQASLSFTTSYSLLKLMSIELMMPSNHLVLSSSSPLAFNLSQHQGLFQRVGSFVSGGQRIGASASASILPMDIQSWFPLGLTGLRSLLSKGLSGVFSSATVWKR